MFAKAFHNLQNSDAATVNGLKTMHCDALLKLSAEQSAHAMTSQHLHTERTAHAGTHRLLVTEQAAHASTKQQLNAEQAAHTAEQAAHTSTKQQLNAEKLSNQERAQQIEELMADYAAACRRHNTDLQTLIAEIGDLDTRNKELQAEICRLTHSATTACSAAATV